MGGKSHHKGHKRGSGKGRSGPRPSGASAPPRSSPLPPPSGDALLLSLTGAPSSLETAAKGDAFPATVIISDATAIEDGRLCLRLDSWAALDPALAWLRDATDADRDLAIEFSSKLGKQHRAAIHAAADAVGLGALASVSRGVGDDRRITVALVSSAVVREARAAEAASTADPAAAAKAALLYQWARSEGAVVSRDEALEIFASGGDAPEEKMPDALAAVWTKRWPRQAAAAALCAAAAAGDAAALEAAINAAPEVVKEGAYDEITGAAPLHAAAATGNVAALEALLAAGAPLDGLDGDDKTALAVSRRCEQCEAEGALLRAGAVDPEAPAAAADVAAWAAARSFGGTVPDSVVSVCGTDTAADRLAELGSAAGPSEFSDADYLACATSGSVHGSLESPRASFETEKEAIEAPQALRQDQDHPTTPDNEIEEVSSGGGGGGSGSGGAQNRLRRRLRQIAPPLPAAVVARVEGAVSYGRAAGQRALEGIGTGVAAAATTLESTRAYALGRQASARAVDSGLAAIEGSKKAIRASADYGHRALESSKAAIGSSLAALEGSAAYKTSAEVGAKVFEGGKAAVEGGRGVVAAAAERGRQALSSAEGLAAAGRRVAVDAAKTVDERARQAAAWIQAHSTLLAAGAGVATATAAVALLLRDRAENTRHRMRYTPRIK